MKPSPAIWFPTVRTNTGTDVFTERLVQGLNERGIKAEVSWLPLRAEYAPWTVPVPKPPEWASVAHVSTWLHPRFIPDLPVVATIHHAVHHPDALSYKGYLRATYHKYWIAPIERRVMCRATKVITVSQFVADTAKKALVDVPMQVIYNGVDTNVFKPSKRARRPDEPFRLLYVGSWMARKGVDLLAPVMRELGGGFELRYTGGSAAERDKLNMPLNMHDIGKLQGDEAVAAAMQEADALLFPSRSEGFGLVAAEAMACGLPVIANNCSSVQEIVDNGVTGLLCPINDVDTIIHTINSLAKDIPRWKSISHIAPQVALERFSIEQMVNSYINHYETLHHV